MDLKLGLGAKAKLALTDSLSQLNSKFRLGTFPGVVQNQASWSGSEMRVWMSVLFVGVACLYGNQVALPMTVVEVEEQLTWQRKSTALLLTSFYWGYMLTQLIGSRLSEKFGGGVVMYFSGFVWSLGVLCVSFAAYVSRPLAVIIRILTGMAQGLHYPALLNLLVHRAPENGKAFFFGLLNTGAYVGCAVTGILSSILLTDHSLNWYYLSVVTGALGVVWALGLRALTLHSLQNHKTHYKLSDGKRYTALSNVGRGRGGNGGCSEGPSSSAAANGLNALRAGVLGSDSPPSPGGTAGGLNISGSSGAVGESSGGGGRVVRDSSKERLKLDVRPSAMMTSCSQLPLRNFIKQPPVLALISAHFSASLFFHNMTCWNSAYFSDLYPQMKDQAWLYNVLPWVAMAIGSAVSSWLAEWMTSHNINLTVIRNIFTSLSLGASSLFLLLLSISGHTRDVHFSLTLFFTFMAFLFAGCYSAGPLANMFDLVTPAQVGMVFTVFSTIGTIPGILGVYLTGIIVQATSSWTLVFSILIVTNVLGTLIFLAFSSGKRLQIADSNT